MISRTAIKNGIALVGDSALVGDGVAVSLRGAFMVFLIFEKGDVHTVDKS